MKIVPLMEKTTCKYFSQVGDHNSRLYIWNFVLGLILTISMCLDHSDGSNPSISLQEYECLLLNIELFETKTLLVLEIIEMVFVETNLSWCVNVSSVPEINVAESAGLMALTTPRDIRH